MRKGDGVKCSVLWVVVQFEIKEVAMRAGAARNRKNPVGREEDFGIRPHF